jgi:CBS domain-containing protein
MKVQDIMTGEPRSLTPNSTVREAAQLMKEINAGVIPVVESGSKKLVGVVTDRDIAIRVVAEGKGSDCRVSEVMSAGALATCTPADDVDRVMETMSREQVRRIPIVDERGSLVGIVAQADIVRKADDKKAERTVEKISQPGREA